MGPRVFVAMSGGVDSSVAAALLVEAGEDVVGITMRLLDEDSPGGCCPSGSVRSAKLACERLGIPHYTWDMHEAFEREVVADFVDEYSAGRTPNPCVRCNDRVKYAALLEAVLRAGGERLATGHYARVVESGGTLRLARGEDPAKDQSYFLYRITPDQLRRTAFPVGAMTKPQVREAAARLGLPTAGAAESQEVCFVADGDVRGFVRERRPDAFRPGDIVDTQGNVVGGHDGVPGYTIGQRKGLGGGGSSARRVVGIDAVSARLVVAGPDELAVTWLRASQPVWHGASAAMRVTARVRYRGSEVPAFAELRGQELVVIFDEPIQAPAPGQSVVCWDGDIVMGGGVIEGAP